MKSKIKRVFNFEYTEDEAILLSNTLKKINGILTAFSLEDEEQYIIDEIIDTVDSTLRH